MFQEGLFDDMGLDLGWQYLMSKIFQIPRSEKFRDIIETR